MGIGLSIIDKIARLHGGSLKVEENHPKWVKFIVRVGR
jgi:signal transduction histidine kinase